MIRRRYGRADRRNKDHFKEQARGLFRPQDHPFRYSVQVHACDSSQPHRLPDNPLELDEELFSALGAQIGGDNESLHNLLLDANAKIGELDTIKCAR